jgi:predicted short-subunit dehydrogenase-like oxidoreductase (DUF2520 family)
MNISIIGSGNVATVLSKLFVEKGHTIHQIICRNESEGNKLALLVNATYSSIENKPDRNIDLCVVAITDGSLRELNKQIHLNFGDIVVAHTAGVCSMFEIENMSTNVGVLYPIQSLRKNMGYIPRIPFLIEASSGPAYTFLENFAKSISDSVTFVEASNRLRLHTAAVIVNNFTNYLYVMGEKFCKDEEVDFNLLKPLIVETAVRIETNAPLDMQTGPAARKDIFTMAKHLELLNAHPKVKTMYTRMSDGIMNGN